MRITQVIAAANKEAVAHIELFDGTVVADTPYNRAMYFRKGWLANVDGSREPIPFTCYTVTGAKAVKRARRIQQSETETTTMPREKKQAPCLETREQMFALGQGKRSHKKPCSGGSFRVNGKLSGMGSNSRLEYAKDRAYFAERYNNIMIQK